MGAQSRKRIAITAAAVMCVLAVLPVQPARGARHSFGEAYQGCATSSTATATITATATVPTTAVAPTPTPTTMTAPPASAMTTTTASATMTATAAMMVSAMALPASSTSNMVTGPVVRTIPVGAVGFETDVVVAARASRAFVLTDEATIVLDARTGGVVRTGPPSTAFGAVAVDERRGRIVVAGRTSYGSGMIALLDARDGSVVQSIVVVGQPLAVAVDAATGRAFVVEDPYSHRVLVVDEDSGRVMRVIAVRGYPSAVVVDEGTNRAFVLSHDNIVFSHPRGPDIPPGYVSVLDACSGATLGTVLIAREPRAAVVNAQTARVLVEGPGYVSMLDAATGRVLRTVPAPVSSADLAIDERTGRVFSLGEYNVLVLDARTGAQLANVDLVAEDVGGTTALRVDARAGRVYVLKLSPYDHSGEVVTGPGHVLVLDATTGALRRRITVGTVGQAGSQALAVDPDSGFVFSLNDFDHSLSIIDGSRLFGARQGCATPTTAAVPTTARATAPATTTVATAAIPAPPGTATATVLATATVAPCPSGTVTPTPSPGGTVVATPVPPGAGQGPAARTIPLPGMATPVVVVVARRTGRAFVLADGATRVLDARTGTPLSERPVALPLAPWAAAVDERHGRVLVAGSILAETFTTGAVAVLDARDGAVLRRILVGGWPRAVALDARAGRLVILDNAPAHERMVVLDEASGRVVRAVALQGFASSLAVDAATDRAFVLSNDQPAINTPGSVIVLDTRNGAVLRTLTVRHKAGSLAVDARTGRAFVSTLGALDVLDAATGRVLRAIPVPDPYGGRATGEYVGLAADEPAGRVLGLQSDRLVVLDARTGALLASRASLGPDSVSGGPLIDPRAGRAFELYLSPRGDFGRETTVPGYVGVFDAATGRRLRTVTVGAVGNPHAQALAVDPDSGLVFSLNDNSVSVIDGGRP